jgi:hypothetical protein
VEESLYPELDRMRKSVAGVLSEIAAKGVLHAPVQSAYARTARSSAHGGPLDLRAQDEIASARRSATPKHVFEQIGG